MFQKEVPLLQIKPYRNNPRDNREVVKYCVKSIRRFGFWKYILVGFDSVIICGHIRFQALKQIGVDRIIVNVADDMSPEQIKAYRLANNKVSEFSKWKLDLLDLELSELEQLDVSMVERGFEPLELNVIGNERSLFTRICGRTPVPAVRQAGDISTLLQF